MSKKGNNFVNIQNRVMSSCLDVGLKVTNKYVKLKQYLKGYRKYVGWYKKLNQKCDADAHAWVSRIALLLNKYKSRATIYSQL